MQRIMIKQIVKNLSQKFLNKLNYYNCNVVIVLIIKSIFKF